jgi:hypothetical protein
MLYYTNSILLFFSAEVNASIITFIATLIVAAFSIHQNFLSRRDINNNIKRVDLTEKKQIIENKLNEFYIPLRHHLEHSNTLYKILKKGKPNDFKTLIFLLERNKKNGDVKKVKLSKNDISLIKAILKIGKKIEKLIHKKSYLIGDDNEFVKEYIPRTEYEKETYEKDMTLLSLLSSHIVTIRMAFNEDLSGQVDKFKGFVFPNEVNIRVNEKIDELEVKVNSYESEILKLNK